MKSFVIREATVADIPALAMLHVTTWNETYPGYPSPPTVELRERQWREAFAHEEGSWFCFVVEASDGPLIGFAKGKRYSHDDLPDYAGELNKIYVLQQYQRRGLGRSLIGHVASRFLRLGISSMVLFSEPDNPASEFFVALGAEPIYAKNGEFHGTYGWRDLNKLAAICPVE